MLPGDTFETIFQITKELSGLPEFRLAPTGLDKASTKLITRLALGVLPAAEAGSVVHVVVREAATDNDLELKRSGHTPAGDDVALLVLSAEQLRGWRAGLREVVEWLAGQEIYYRTGYSDSEIAIAVAAMGD
ncbi:MAG: hypothetical protein ACRYF3_16905 [Janthinobacterium lividum]